ncbi:MAG TPA: protein phosphatase 2C domain-containing protein, partial [Gemmatimonadales bacterium]
MPDSTRADLLTAIVPPEAGRKPRDDELDLFGLTHPGNVRQENQDHFLVATVHHQVVIHGTSLPDPDKLPLRGERLATIALVADGVGGGAAGREASQLAVETIARYVSSTMLCFHGARTAADREFHDALRAAALEAHAAVRAEGAGRSDMRTMATTLTLVVAVWPLLYVTQVGDSRCYLFKDGRLHQVTRDQTVAQGLVERGALSPDHLADSPFSHVLASSIGGSEAAPEVTRLDLNRGSVALLCSDGLTAHVTNAEIEQQVRVMESSEQVCRSLLALALERGGSDNVTILVGRARPSA